MKKYFDKYGQEIQVGLNLVYEWKDGMANYVGPVVECNGDLGVLDYFSSEFISLSTTDLPHVRIDTKR